MALGLRSLLDRGPAALRPPPHDPSPDRAPDSLAGGIAQPLRGELETLLGADRVLARPGDLIRYASDASPYRLLPRAVVMAKEADDVAKVLAFGRAQDEGAVARYRPQPPGKRLRTTRRHQPHGRGRPGLPRHDLGLAAAARQA